MSLGTNSSDVIIVDSSPSVQEDERGVSHFALIFIDRAGNLRHETSSSISESRDRILSPQVTNQFLQAVSTFEDDHATIQQPQIGAQATSSSGLPTIQPAPQINRTYTPHTTENSAIQTVLNGQAAQTPQVLPIPWPRELVHRSERASELLQHEATSKLAVTVPASKNIMISLGNANFIRRYYEKVFENLQQTNCRILAKVYVRLVEPRKQVRFPYNGRKNVAGVTHQWSPEETKPPWWPLEVRHREPDHLHKAERIELLVHILSELRASHGVTARRLRAADETIRRQICPSDRIGLLDELYYVREKQEKLLDGTLNVNARVSISRDNVPDDLELAILQNQICIRGSPTSHKFIAPPITQGPPLLGGSIPEIAHILPPGSGAIDNEKIKSTHQLPVTSPQPVSLPTNVTPSNISHHHQYSQTSFLSTPSSVSMDQYFPDDFDYQSYLPEAPHEIPSQELEYSQSKARSRMEIFRETVNVDESNQGLEACAWY
ncbi:uncharacterized protein N7511_007833 [Penicillium nucicola]|uniref:uncharacterized protein n=1 Tax=Penicillium nucicola TaxID=1850975 RepID=UPI002545216C|nr:uncharacterized protein N7511_007833 [Penicillium nucicola]KAJ5753680.1 hypothetical protein N7511_007833 [Penicillium nucicola]